MPPAERDVLSGDLADVRFESRTAPSMLRVVSSPNARWSIGLAAWIIQDGNYADFNVGDRAEFALEFYAAGDVELVPDSDVHATQMHDDRYDAVGRVVHVDERCWVVDFGLLAYHEGVVPGGVVPGQTIRATIGLGVDPFMYFERLRVVSKSARRQRTVWPSARAVRRLATAASYRSEVTGVAVLLIARFSGEVAELTRAHDRAHAMIMAAGGAEQFGELRRHHCATSQDPLYIVGDRSA